MCFTIAIALVCLLNSGCSSDEGSATISGKVELSGRPVPYGLVVFKSETAICAGSIKDGQYELNYRGKQDLPLGDYVITVIPPVDGTNSDENGQANVKVDLSLFPEKFRSNSTSGLKFSPDTGYNEFDIMMEK